jgi:hypothetical protein
MAIALSACGTTARRTSVSSACPSSRQLIAGLSRLVEVASGMISRECGESRIMAGFHYRFSVNAGAHMGRRVAKKIVDSQLLPR